MAIAPLLRQLVQRCVRPGTASQLAWEPGPCPAATGLLMRRGVASSSSGATLPFVEPPPMASETASQQPAAASDAASGSDHGASETAVAVTGAQVYRRTREEHNRVFRWGIGNKFRMFNKNRFTPVHKPHPKEVNVRDDYYETDNTDIIWEELNEAWEVHWYEHNKLNAKPFPVKKFGVERAKREAWKFYDELKETGRMGEKHSHVEFEAPTPGVFFDYRMQGWVTFFWRGGRPHSRIFSARKYGFDGAKMLAETKQKDPVNGLYPVLGGGGTPVHLKKTGRGH